MHTRALPRRASTAACGPRALVVARRAARRPGAHGLPPSSPPRCTRSPLRPVDYALVVRVTAVYYPHTVAPCPMYYSDNAGPCGDLDELPRPAVAACNTAGITPTTAAPSAFSARFRPM